MKYIPNSLGQPFARLGCLLAALGAVALMTSVAPTARASDPNGIYAFVDRVVFEPSEAAPERIQVWGGFALAKKTPNNSEYHDAERGYMYFKLRSGDNEICKKEWADLKAVAGTRKIVAFGSRYEEPQPKLRKPDAKPENPDLHPKSWGGVVKVYGGGTNRDIRNHPPVNQLLKLMDKETKKSPKAKIEPGAKDSLFAFVVAKPANN